MSNILNKIFDTDLTELERINLMEQLHSEEIDHSKYELAILINKSIEKQNLPVLGYCLVKSDELNLEEIFLNCMKGGFLKGLQLISYQMDLSNHINKKTLIESSFLLAIEKENYKDLFNFLIKKGGDYYFNDNQLFKNAFESQKLDVLEYLIKSNLGTEDFKKKKDSILKSLSLENKDHIIQDWLNSEIKIVHFAHKQPLKTVMHKKI